MTQIPAVPKENMGDACLGRTLTEMWQLRSHRRGRREGRGCEALEGEIVSIPQALKG